MPSYACLMLQDLVRGNCCDPLPLVLDGADRRRPRRWRREWWGNSAVRTVAILAVVGVAFSLGSPNQASAGTAPSADLAPAVAILSTPVLARTECGSGLPSLDPDVEGSHARTLESVQSKYMGQPGFLAAVMAGGSPWIVVEKPLLAHWRQVLAGTDVSAAASCTPPGLLVAAGAAAEKLGAGKNRYASSFYNAITDSVDISTSESVEQVAIELASQKATGGAVGLEAASRSGSLRVTSSGRGSSSRLSGRLADVAPFWGGGKVTFPGSCSTGVYLSSNTFGTVLTTAGHCATNGTTAWNGDHSLVVGTVEGRSFPDPDIELMDGQNYWPREFCKGDNTSWCYVIGDGTPVVNVTYCNLGYVSRHLCSKYNAIDARYCDASGCTYHLAHTQRACSSGVLGSPGDSGAPVAEDISSNTVRAKATVVAGTIPPLPTTCERWDQRMDTILDHYSAGLQIEFPPSS